MAIIKTERHGAIAVLILDRPETMNALGALGDGDIGSHFPPSDQRWRGAASEIFLAHAMELVAKRGGRISHLDVTILCEEPRIAPHRVCVDAIDNPCKGRECFWYNRSEVDQNVRCYRGARRDDDRR